MPMLHVMERSQLSIETLPNEIVIQILGSFSTRSLLPLAAVCRRFHGLVGRVHYARLVRASRMQDHEVILECYHPSEKLSAPSLSCEYLGTDGLSEAADDANLGVLHTLYARFRPYLSYENYRPRSRWQTGVQAGSALDPATRMPSHEVSLESGELFSQLCTGANLAKVGPRRGLFSSNANVADGVIRVWRDWLQREAADTAARQQQQRAGSNLDDPSILWINSSKVVGLRFRVVEDESAPAPILVGPDDEPPVSYSLEYQELFVRADWLLLSFENSEAQQATQAGSVYLTGSGGAPRQPCNAFLQYSIPSTPRFQTMFTALVT
ncbi:hypothetical protein GGS23DRAFT_573906 [Durotheca rogersii]|uniref:uncharacterized protein n=1 Tax=Durotheca rogersii TaxID=419775 RepID=UPI00221E933E|nr:uncharacterized protein GGS23DRAFT_573906 [Durotheca rogersii]KAI5861953.1 hypothetical protein GGS23DRAFT_573906 [Durotheca rogersii]